MKNEEIIMAEGLGGGMDNRAEKIEQNKVVEKPVEKGGARIVQKPGTLKQEAVADVGSKEQAGERGKFIDLKPETEEKLKRFSVEIEADGKKEKKTALDAVIGMNVLSKKELPLEQKNRAYLERVMLVDKLMQKYGGSKEGEDLQKILFNEVFGGGNEEKGQKAQEWFQSQVNAAVRGEGMQIDVNGLAEIMGSKLDKTKMNELGELIKLLPAPEERSGGAGGVGPAPMVTVGEDGRVTVTPAPDEGGGISKTPDTPGGKPPGGGDGGVGVKKEKDKFDWYKYGQGFLFLLILYFGIQGWYARMVEQMAERAR